MNKFLTIDALQDGLKKGEFSGVDVVEHYLERINTLDPDLGSFLTVTEDEAHAKAKEVDRLIKAKGRAAFKEFPLLGVVVAHKDMFLTKGVRTTAASKLLRDYVPAYSATLVARMERAGAIMIGKLNCDAWAHGSSGENSDFYVTKNPYNKAYVPGGSSSGSGAAVAAGLTVVASGTDTCGSIRLPANFCGVSGLKPTYGAVSRYGVVAMASSLDSIGHLGRTAKDLKTVFEVTKGPDGKDGTVDKYPKPNTKNLKEMTIGIPKEYFGGGLAKEVAENIDEAKSDLSALGVKFKEVSLPTTKHAISVYYIVQPAEVSSNLGRYDSVRYGAGRDAFGAEAKRRIMLGTYVLSAGYSARYYEKAMRVRTKLIAEVDKVFEGVDALLAPVAPTPPFKLGEKVDDPLKMYLTDIYAATANLTGIPGIALPSGMTKNGLPLGFQLMAKRFAEDTLFTLGMAYQAKTTWHETTPETQNE